jgi:hypothetical protein
VGDQPGRAEGLGGMSADVIPAGLRAHIASLRGWDTLCLPAGQLRDLVAEYDRLLDLACKCESGLGGCEAHRIPSPPPCSCGHQKALHDPGCLCAWGRGIDCACPAYEPGQVTS